MTLNRQDLLKLAKEAKALSEWTIVRDFANQVYGKNKAAKVEIETYGEYNDEGGTNYHIESINAYDKDGNELDVDYSLPFFQSKTWKEYTDEDEGFLYNYREAYNVCNEGDDEYDKWVLFDDLPVNKYGEAFDLTVESKLSFMI